MDEHPRSFHRPAGVVAHRNARASRTPPPTEHRLPPSGISTTPHNGYKESFTAPAADLFRREIGERVVVVPESATLLFAGGFPRPDASEAQRAAQLAIFHVQYNLEDIQAALYPDRVLLCDRRTVDGGAYWPDGADDFFAEVGSSHADQIARYDVKGQ